MTVTDRTELGLQCVFSITSHPVIQTQDTTTTRYYYYQILQQVNHTMSTQLFIPLRVGKLSTSMYSLVFTRWLRHVLPACLTKIFVFTWTSETQSSTVTKNNSD